ncbi:MAG TPA: hypothetical protein DD415_01890 [Clostridiales bacterium]|nr:hypothetical protein [Clostridiales bacterium]
MITKAQKNKARKGMKSLAAIGVCATMMTTAGIGTIFASAATGLAANGKYYASFSTVEEAYAAAKEVAVDIAAEGQTLLKNKEYANKTKALPMVGQEYVSVFGVGQDVPAGSTTKNYGPDVNLLDALQGEGFRVNPALRGFYEADNTSVSGKGGWNPGSSIFKERTDFGKGIEESFGIYNDAAIIVLSRGGGEGNDVERKTAELQGANDWHGAPYTEGEGSDAKKYKHFLQMTDTEEALLKYVKAQGFKKIIYVINSSQIFELHNLEQDNDVDGILWIGRPGGAGMEATAKILSGKINPSGRTVDTWYKDFTVDPTWYNFGDNSQVGGGIAYTHGTDKDGKPVNTGWYGVDYDEDIYVGYRYYETKAADMNSAKANSGNDWYDDAVVYPFGYGLSYSEFSYKNMSVKVGGEELGATVKATDLSSSIDADGTKHEAKIKTLTVSVDVHNDGPMAGKHTVELYVNAPYFENEVEKSHVKLVGFGKSEIIRPGETQTVTMTVNVQDLASYDYTDANHNGFKGYELDEGDYKLMALQNAHGWAEQNVIQKSFKITDGLKADGVTSESARGAAYMQLDDFSGNEIENLFSKENGAFYSLRDSSEGVTYKANKDATATQVLMSRATGLQLPETTKAKELELSDEMFKSIKYWDNFSLDTTVKVKDENGKEVEKVVAKPVSDEIIPGNSNKPDAEKVYYKDGQTIAGVVSEADFPWLKDTLAAASRMGHWDQKGTYKYDDGTTVKLSDMAGIDPFGTEKIGGTGRFKDMTGAEAWDVFMNTLTWKDLMDIVGQYQKKSWDAISMNQLKDFDNATNPGDGITFNFGCNCILAATWNTELAYAKGLIVGDMALLNGKNCWWGGAAQTHRSPFGGRVYEYQSEDGILAGYIGAGESLGVNSKGIATYYKHCALNDQETNRNKLNLFAWVSEQAVREIYFKSFQIAAQEGQSSAIMGAFARAGRMSLNVNYNFVTGLFRKEWGRETISFTTDMYSPMKGCSPLDLLVRAGTDTIATNTMSGTWEDDKLTIGSGDAVSVKNQWYTTRHCAMIFLWTHANTAMNMNGVSFDWSNAELSATQGTAVANATVSCGATGEKVVYSLTAGSLPAGLTLDRATGKIEGTTTAKAGEYKFTVQCLVDGWVKGTKAYTYTVATPFTISENAGEVGEEFYATLDGIDGATYEVKEGALPEGLALTDGVIEGTPVEAGEFKVTMLATVGTGKNVKTYEFDVTLTIEGETEVTDHGNIVSTVINDKGELEITYADGFVDNLGVVVGKDGADGKDGVNGQDGAPGKDAEGGCNGSVATTIVPLTAAFAFVGAAVIILRKKNANK